jgi:hypothetical protein
MNFNFRNENHHQRTRKNDLAENSHTTFYHHRQLFTLIFLNAFSSSFAKKMLTLMAQIATWVKSFVVVRCRALNILC